MVGRIEGYDAMAVDATTDRLMKNIKGVICLISAQCTTSDCLSGTTLARTKVQRKQARTALSTTVDLCIVLHAIFSFIFTSTYNIFVEILNPVAFCNHNYRPVGRLEKQLLKPIRLWRQVPNARSRSDCLGQVGTLGEGD